MASPPRQLLPSSKHKDVRQLLLDLFSLSELRMFVADHYPDVQSAVAWQQAPAHVAYELVVALGKRGLLDGALAAALSQERPTRRPEIEALWGFGGSSSAGQTPAAHTSLGGNAAAPGAGATAPGAGRQTAAGARQATVAEASEAPFDVFLSHNSKDKPLVRSVATRLMKHGLRVWLDEWELIPGRPWQQALEEIIATTKTAAVFVGSAGIGPWEEPEMRACLSQFVVRNLPVIPVLLPGAPARVQLPLFLRDLTWVNLRDDDEHGINRLLWGITGVKPKSWP